MAESAVRAVDRYQTRLASQERAGLRADILVCALAGLGALGSLQVAWAPSLPLLTPAEGPTVATVVRTLGETRHRRSDSLAWEPLALEAALHAEDILYVPENGELVLRFLDGATAHVDAGSLIVLEQQEQIGQQIRPGVEVRRGGVLGRTVADSTLSVRSGETQVALQGGTDLTLRRDARRGARVSIEGAGAEVRHGGQTLKLQGREEVAVGAAGEVVERLRHTIDLLGPANGERLLRLGAEATVTFAWSSDAGEGVYELTVARDPALEQIAHQERSTEASLTSPLTQGIYYWRVRRGTATSPVHRLVLIRDRPPRPLEPSASTTVLVRPGENLRFRWIPSTATSLYQVRLLQGAEVETARVVFDAQSRRPLYVHRGDLSEGLYRWEVRAVDPTVERAPPRVRPRFRIINRALPEAPEIIQDDFAPMVPLDEVPAEAPSVPPAAPDAADPPEQGSLLRDLFISTAYAQEENTRPPRLLRWRAVAGITTYQIQLARDPKFKQIVEDQKVAATFLRWSPPDDSPVFYLRVRSIDAENRAGPFSGAQAIRMALLAPRGLAPDRGKVLTPGAEAIELTCLAPREAGGIEVEITGAASPGGARQTLGVRRGERLLWRAPQAGRYTWRARTVLDGVAPSDWSEPATFEVLPLAPKLVEPDSDDVIARAVPAQLPFTWKLTALAEAYELQLARDSDFTRGLQAVRTRSPTTKIAGVESGEWSWRVRALGALEASSAWSPTRSFRLRAPSIALSEPAGRTRVVAGKVSFRWKKVAGAVRYRLEVIRQGVPRSEGRTLIRVESPRAELELGTEGVHRWRVMAEDGQGRLLGISARREFTVEAAAPVGVAGGASSDATISIEPVPVRIRRRARVVIALASLDADPAAELELEGKSSGGSLSAFEPAGAGRRSGFLRVPEEPPISEVTVTVVGNGRTLSRTVPVSREVTAVELGPRLGASWNLGRTAGIVPGLELVWRPSWRRGRLAGLVGLGYGWGSAHPRLGGNDLRITSVLHRIPLDLLALWSFDGWAALGEWKPLLGGGLRLEPVFSSVKIEGVPVARASGFLGGPSLVAGVGSRQLSGHFRILLHLVYASPAGGNLLVGGPWMGLSAAWRWRVD